MFIQTEETPNPQAMKFFPGQEVMGTGARNFDSKEVALCSPLALQLFNIKGVSNVFFGHDYVTVTKETAKDWNTLKPAVLGAIMDYYLSGKPLFYENATKEEKATEDDPLTAQIKELLETRVRPAIAMDGGDIVFEDFQDGVVFVKLHGACAGCPSSTATLKSGIENMLRHYIPEVQEVRATE